MPIKVTITNVVPFDEVSEHINIIDYIYEDPHAFLDGVVWDFEKVGGKENEHG